MQCPKCHGALRPQLFGEVEVEQCVDCHGVWLDLGELPLLRRAANTTYSDATTDTPIYDTLTAPCPRCGGEGHMTRVHDLKRPDIIIDSCPICYGIWLDGGELDKLTQKNVGLVLKDFIRDLLS